jgi:hypothetical protein
MGSFEESGANFGFQVDDLGTERGVADPQGKDGFAKALVFCDSQERAAMSEFHRWAGLLDA